MIIQMSKSRQFKVTSDQTRDEYKNQVFWPIDTESRHRKGPEDP
jgi:hypothetical protein